MGPRPERGRPRAPAPVTAGTRRRAVRGAAAAPQRSCPARPAAAGAAGAAVAAVASRPGLGAAGLRPGARKPRADPAAAVVLPALLGDLLGSALSSTLLPGPPRAAPRTLSPASGRRSGAHVTGACEHAPRGPAPARPAPGPSLLPPRPRQVPGPRSEGGERSRELRAEAHKWGRLPVASASGAGSGSSAVEAGGGRWVPRGSPRLPVPLPRPEYPGPCRTPTRNFNLSAEGLSVGERWRRSSRGINKHL
ncbi:translation initiation factor IF-2-like [Pipistrellus kuhlii]|uniref:translation initiation factor IF-2-like n=1 Tax=Pipistrellus kuhlii TaxID=59472 RepID=UPI001E273C4A|nr:translation initiation factor IF-2-like [Pipistrellus kuhlii]